MCRFVARGRIGLTDISYGLQAHTLTSADGAAIASGNELNTARC